MPNSQRDLIHLAISLTLVCLQCVNEDSHLVGGDVLMLFDNCCSQNYSITWNSKSLVYHSHFLIPRSLLVNKSRWYWEIKLTA